MKGITEFRNRHRGEDIYVVGAGASLNYLDREFFTGKITVMVNTVALTWGVQPTYIVAKEHAHCVHPNAARFPDTPIIVSLHDCGSPVRPANFSHPNVHVFDHLPNAVQDFDAGRDWPTEENSLVVSWSTITSAMHFAAYLGAATIIVAGHDCGQMGTDGPYMKGYGVSSMDWLLQIERQSRAVKEQLIWRYGCRVYGLSPFITPDLEGVPFIGANKINIPEA